MIALCIMQKSEKSRVYCLRGKNVLVSRYET